MHTERKYGFTLVELLITAAASSILMLTVGVLLVSAIRSWRSNNAYVDMRRDAAFALELMARDIRQAEHRVFNYTDNYLFIPTIVAEDEYSATFSVGTNDTDLVYSRKGDVVRLARNVDLFVPEEHTNITGEIVGLTLRLEMKNDEFNISLTNETFISFRNPSF